MQRGRRQEAETVLASVRTEEDKNRGWVNMELLAIEETLEAEKNIIKNNWLELFKGNNLHRTSVCFNISSLQASLLLKRILTL